MKILTRIIFPILAFVCTPVGAQALPRSEPEDQGLSSSQLLEFVDALDSKIDGIHSVMVLRHGKVVAEGWWAPYSAESNHVLYSLSKSFTSTAVGFAVAEGKVDLFDPVLKFFPDDAPADPSGNLKAMRVRDLLTMSTGHQDEPPTSPEKMSVVSFLAHPVPHKPGTHFRYNTAATFMQSAIVQKVTGQTLLEYLKPRLFEPLGIADPLWDTNFEGISLGGYGLRVKTEDIAKFGQLYLQKGEWNGKQLLPETWVEQAISRQMSTGSNPNGDGDQGYGFQFWRCRHNAYRGVGAFGQYCVVMPDQDMVIAITSGEKNMGAILDVIWDKLLPAAGEGSLAANAEGVSALRKRLAGLELALAKGQATPDAARNYLDRLYKFPKNEQGFESLKLSTALEGGGLELVTRVDGVENRVPCGFGKWMNGRSPYAGGHLAQFPDEPVASSFAWADDHSCLIKQFAYETPFGASLRLSFAGDEVTFEREGNVGFGPTTRKKLVGHARVGHTAPRIAQLPPGGLVPDAEVDENGVIHVAFLLGGDVLYIQSTDEGQTFSKPVRVNTEAGFASGGQFRGPDLAIGKNGKVHVIWYNAGYQQKRPHNQWGVMYSRLDEKTMRFEKARNLNKLPSDNFSLAADSTGRVAVIWMAGKINATLSADGGTDFTEPADLGVDPCECCGSRATYARDGSLLVLYRDKTDNLRDTNVATLATGAAKWSNRVISESPWLITSCPMTGSFLGESKAGIAAAWETSGQVFFRVGLGAGTKEIRVAEKGRYPVVLTSGGTTLVAWKDDKQLKWQVFDRENRSVGKQGRHTGTHPDRPAGVVAKSGRVILIP
ncbi:MAG: CubicO group peptidase (beta-lactamase class C family) [Verrucomicrobiales bacterium]|jgi:CubicO group peptidase (beta-lactamase class C family)